MEDQDALKIQDEDILVNASQNLDSSDASQCSGLTEICRNDPLCPVKERILLFLDKIAEDFARRTMKIIHLRVYSNFPLDHQTSINWIMSQHNFPMGLLGEEKEYTPKEVQDLASMDQ